MTKRSTSGALAIQASYKMYFHEGHKLADIRRLQLRVMSRKQRRRQLL
jgi:hypothetical protein